MMYEFFRAGGSLPYAFPSYVERKADVELYQHLKSNDFCYVLTARQMGKSSLKIRMMKMLLEEGWSIASVDLTAFGTTGFTSEQWYQSFLLEIADTLGIEDKFSNWWETTNRLTPVAKMTLFWEDFLLRAIDRRIVIFIDEIDVLLSLDKDQINTDDFFAAIRALYNKRSVSPKFALINFCIFGVAAPQDLMRDRERTPFNIGIPISISNFTLLEAQTLAKGFSNNSPVNQSLLRRALYWTNGQPYLTQKLCKQLCNEQVILEESDRFVDYKVAELFLNSDVLNNDPHFSNIQNRIITNSDHNLGMLNTYQKIQKGENIRKNKKANDHLYLMLSGIVHEDNGCLTINNIIYERIFDYKWLEVAYDRIERPFAIDLRRWLAANKSNEILLKGILLKQALSWAESRYDLSKEEQEYLQTSRLEELKSEESKLRIKQRKKFQKKIIYASIIASLLAIIALFTAYISYNQASIAKNRYAAWRIKEVAENIRPRNKDLAIRLLELAKNYDNNLLVTRSIYETYRSGNYVSVFSSNKSNASIVSVAYAFNGQSFATGYVDGLIRLWDVESGLIIKEFQGHSDEIVTIIFSENKNWLISSSKDSTVRLWDISSERELLRITHEAVVNSLVLSADENLLLTSSDDKTTRLWKISPNRDLEDSVLPIGDPLEDKTTRLRRISQSTNLSGQGLPVGDPLKGEQILLLDKHTAPVKAATFSQDGTRIFTGTNDGSITIWDASSGERIIENNISDAAILNFHTKNHWAIGISKNNKIIVWDINKNYTVVKTKSFNSKINTVSLSSEGNLLLVGLDDNTSVLFDITLDHPIERFIGHNAQVNSVTFSPNGKWILSGSEDNTARIWKTPQINEVLLVEDHSSKINSIHFSPNGMKVAALFEDQKIKIWDLGSKEEFTRAFTDGDTINLFTFSSDGQLAIIGLENKSIVLWDLISRKIFKILKENSNQINCLSVSHDKKMVLYSSSNQTAKLMNISSGKIIKEFKRYNSKITSLNFSPKDKYVFAGYSDGVIKMWHIDSSKEQKNFIGHRSEVTNIQISANGNWLLSASQDRSARLWSIKSGQELKAFNGHDSAVTKVSFSKDHELLVSNSLDRTVRLWNVNSGMEIKKVESTNHTPVFGTFSSHGDLMTCELLHSTLRVKNSAINSKEVIFPNHNAVAESVTFTHNGGFIITGSADGVIRLCNAFNGEQLSMVKDNAAINAVTLTADEKMLVTANNDKSIKVWSVNENNISLKQKIDQYYNVNDIQLTSDSKKLLIGSFDNTIRLWDFKMNTVTKHFFGHTGEILSLSLSRDDKLLLTGSRDKTARLWDMETQREITKFIGHTDFISDVAFSPDEKYVLTGSGDKTARLWDIETGSEVKVFEGHESSILTVDYSPNGNQIITGSADRTLRVWEVKSGQESLRTQTFNSWISTIKFAPSGNYIFIGSGDKKARIIYSPALLEDFLSTSSVPRLREQLHLIDSAGYIYTLLTPIKDLLGTNL